MTAAAALAALALLAAPDFASRPLSVRTAGTFRDLFLDPVLADARPRERPALDVRWSFANDWTTSTVVRRGGDAASLQDDAQNDELRVSATIPWRGLTLGAEWRLVEHWGGWSDAMIETWHRVLHVYNYERLDHRRDAVAIRLGGDGERPVVDLRGGRLAWGDLVLRAAAPVARGEAWAVALRADVKLPTGKLEWAGGSGGADGAVAIAASAAAGSRVTLHAMASATAVSGLPRAALVQPRRLQLGADASAAIRLGAFTLLVEDRVRTALFAGGWRYDGDRDRRRSSAFLGAFRPLNLVSVGLRRGPLTVWFSEDVTPGGGDPAQGFYYLANQPDLVFGLAWAREL